MTENVGHQSDQLPKLFSSVITAHAKTRHKTYAESVQWGGILFQICSFDAGMLSMPRLQQYLPQVELRGHGAGASTKGPANHGTSGRNPLETLNVELNIT